MIKRRYAMKSYANATNLKYFAVILMVLDHIHQMFYEFGAPIWLTAFGRLVFPIFLFLFADSFYYTRSRKKLITRLLLMSWLMSIGNFVIGNLFDNGHIGLMNNAFSTFLVVAILDSGWDRMVDSIKEKSTKNFFIGFFIFILPVLLSIIVLALGTLVSGEGAISPILTQLISLLMLMIPNLVTIEGGYIMVLLGLILYIFRNNRKIQFLAILIAGLLSFYFDKSGIQWMMVFSIIPLYFYNGERGKGNKNFFYIFYPTHIYLLYIIASLLH